MSQISNVVPPLNKDAWINKAIDSVKFIGDVGETDLQFLEFILPHCTVDQLMHIENCSKGKDLTPITNNLWKNFYERKFGKDDVDTVVKRVQHRNETFKWMNLYVAKMEELESKARKIEDRITQTYQKEKARKQSPQIIFCDGEDSSLSNKNPKSKRIIGFESNTTKSKIPKKAQGEREPHVCNVSPFSNKKHSFERAVGSTRSSKSKILKKAKRETLQSIEMKNLIAFRRNAVQKW